MTTKGSSCKQVIVPMNSKAAGRLLKNSNMHVININRALKNIKSKIMADFICIEDKDIVISTNNVVSPSDLQEIEKYIKSSLANNSDKISSLRLPQSKFYLKIVGISYVNKQSNLYIFNNIALASRLRIIKFSLKSDMAIIWINIWDTQNGSKAKSIINQHFNVGSFITMVCGVNMNPSVPQCKNCWK